MKSKSLLPIILIFGLTFVVWHKVLGQTFLGEAYMYFPPSQNFFVNKIGFFDILKSYNNFARIMFDIFPPIFKDNLQLYLLLQLIITATLCSSLYWVLYKISKNRILGFSAAIFFLSNFTGSFEMMAEGTYQRFAERVTGLIPVIFAFYFLDKFYKKEKKYHLFVISTILFALGILMGHYTTFLLPFFVLYPMAQFIYNKKTKKSFLINSFIILSFIFVNYYITKGSNQKQNGNIIEFLTQEDNLIERFLLQIPVITIPPGIIKSLSQFYPHLLPVPYIPILRILLFPTITLYLVGLFLVRKQNKGLKILYLTVFLGMLSEMLLYMYVDRRLNVLVNFGESRFFYITSMFAAISWAIIIAAAFAKKESTYKIAAFLILTSYLIYNSSVIWKKIDAIQYKSEMMKRYISYIKQISPQFNENTVIIVPVHILWPDSMIKLYYGNPKMTITGYFDGWEDNFRDRKNDVFVFDYDYEITEKREFDPQKGHVVDLTAKYRKGEKINFLYE